MTPKDKAIELVDKYRVILMREDTDCGNEILCSKIAKECALIAVDVLIDEYKAPDRNFYWWNYVKEEIKGL